MSEKQTGVAVIPMTPGSWRNLQEVLRSMLESGQHLFVLDCQGLQRINSQTVSDVAGYQAWLDRHGARLALANLTPEAQELFRMLGLDQAFALDLDIEGAREVLLRE